MKKCDLCNKPDKTHYRVKSIRIGFFVVKNVGIKFLKIKIIPMVELESQNNLLCSELTSKKNK